jgi:hypothetical protein
MEKWIITFVSVSLCVFVVNILLENTKYAPFAKKSLSVILALALSLPVFSLFSSDFGILMLENAGITIEDELYDEILGAKLNAIRAEILDEFERNGLKSADVFFTIADDGATIYKIFVDISNAEYIGSVPNINEISKYVNNVFTTSAEIVLYD